MTILKRLFFAAVVSGIFAVMMTTAAQAQSSGGGELSESDALNTANQWASLVGKPDIAGLEALLHERYVHIHATALVESKAQFIDALKTGARKYDPIKIEEPSARVFDNFAVVNGKFNLKAFSRGRTVEGVNRFSLVIAKTPTGLQAVSFQATPIPQK